MTAFEKLEDLDWDNWSPVDRATLLFVIRRDQILLIRKKRGLGQGKINGPGGRLQDGESPREAAVREVEEELRVVPTGVREAGELQFQFADGYSIHVYVFTAGDCLGQPEETNEASPLWFPVADIPYDEMWADDAIWVPMMLAEERFFGRFVFDGDRMLDHRVDSVAPTKSGVQEGGSS